MSITNNSEDKITAEIKVMDEELARRFDAPYFRSDRERVLVELVADLRLRVSELENRLKREAL